MELILMNFFCTDWIRSEAIQSEWVLLRVCDSRFTGEHKQVLDDIFVFCLE
jgi:hypothetical protein